MPWEVMQTCILIVLARIADVSLGTLRATSVYQGRRLQASVFGFFEVLVWILVASKVIQNLDNVFYILSYAGGFAVGCYLGMLVEAKLAFGERMLWVFSHQGDLLSRSLRASGHAVSVFEGAGRDGRVSLLLLKIFRRDLRKITHLIRQTDPKAIPITDNASVYSFSLQPPVLRK